ncbi:hypothetical protein BaRGS_00037813, partial [Batillaria attramentaria]
MKRQPPHPHPPDIRLGANPGPTLTNENVKANANTRESPDRDGRHENGPRKEGPRGHQGRQSVAIQKQGRLDTKRMV